MPTRSAPKKKKVATKKRTVSKKKVMKKATTKKIIKPKVLGKVEHYYDRIGVAIVELIAPVAVGDTVTFRFGEDGFDQRVQSIQINHVQVPKAKKGDVIGVKVDRKIHDGALVVPAK